MVGSELNVRDWGFSSPENRVLRVTQQQPVRDLRHLCQTLYMGGHGERMRANGQKLKQQGQTGYKEKKSHHEDKQAVEHVIRDLVPKYLGLISQLAMLFACSF